MATYSNVESAATPARPAPRVAHRARTRALVALLVALVAGFGASWLISRALSNGGQSSPSMALSKVAVVKSELALATTLTAEMIDVVDWPTASLPKGAFEDPGLLVGRVIKTPMVAGEPLVEARLAPKQGGMGLAAMIPPDMRAMTVRVNEASGVAGFVHPGDLVDVIPTMTPEGQGAEVRSRIVLQNIRVLAVGQKLETGSAQNVSVPVVTLLVSPEESERLALAASHGELQLTMRSGIDDKEVATEGVAPQEMYENDKDKDRAAARARAELARQAVPDPNNKAGQAVVRRRPVVAAAAEPAPVIVTPTAPREDVVEIIRGNTAEQRKIKPVEGGR